MLNRLRLTGFNGVSQFSEDAWKVVGMDEIGNGPTFQLLERSGGVLEDLLIDELNFFGGSRGKDKSRDAIDDLPEAQFARA